MYKVDLKDWPLEKGDYLLGNPKSPVAVVTPIPDKKIWKAGVEKGAAIGGRLLTANIGLEKLVCNIVSNPNIRFLVLAGKESRGHKSGDALLALKAHGYDPKTKRIKGTKAQTPYLWNLEPGVVKRFREQVEVIDLLGRPLKEVLKAVEGCYQEEENKVAFEGHELFDPGAFGEPLNVKVEDRLQKDAIVEPVSDSFFAIYTETISKAWPKILGVIDVFGVEMQDERGTISKECLNVAVHIRDPLRDMIPDGFSMNKASLDEYSMQLLSPSRKGFEYTYGERMRGFRGDIDQIGYIIKKLKKNPNSRRAVATLWDPLLDQTREEVPCLSMLDFVIREGRLNLTAVLRSNDMQRAWPANAFGLAKVMEYVSEKLGVNAGTLTTLSISAHVYLN